MGIFEKLFGKKKATPAPAMRPQPVNIPRPAPAPVIRTPREFPPYTGTGVCDVCNQSLMNKKAYIVPNPVFYRSPKYRDYVRHNSMSAIMGIPMPDSYFEGMLAKDHSAGSAVCENCIHMFK